ncbi:MAG TPA: M14 family zinc carboxypeptidase, partial [bacterium]|nr:M14 family zinc carboxypeptidase [bacterium]
MGASEQTLLIDADFPGGNIVVERIEGDDCFVHQDLRDTTRDWFYWCFRVRNAQGRRLTFHFTQSNVLGVEGPAVSLDQGVTWRWLGDSCIQEKAFSYSFGLDEREVRFSFGMPYLEEHLARFLTDHRQNQFLRTETLCTSRKGRTVARIHIGCIHREPVARVLLTCRHHCCEMMASYSLQGLMQAVISNSEEFAWLRNNVEFLVVPFVDKDGVEDGDQGKMRHPHDHNRDYLGEPADSIYPEVRALREFVPKWSGGLLRVGLDLHCPYIRGAHNEV